MLAVKEGVGLRINKAVVLNLEYTEALNNIEMELY